MAQYNTETIRYASEVLLSRPKFQIRFLHFFPTNLAQIYIWQKVFWWKPDTKTEKKKKKEPAEFHNVNYFIISQGNLKPLMVKNYKKNCSNSQL